ncbi:hypothetical protein [Dokdonella sp.]|uniref:hypothetical protein n=1 Tax=Dokdonella sp. TaxID=2291710 RepID=UPI003C60F025
MSQLRFGFSSWGLLLGCLAMPSANAGQWGGAIGASSENIYRGIALSDGQWSGYGDIHYEFSPRWIAGIGANSIRLPGQPEDIQLTFYLDRRWRLGEDWIAKLGFVHYDTVRASNRTGLQYDEINAAISYRGRWLGSLAWSPKVGNAYAPELSPDSSWLWLETAWRQSLGERFSLDLGLGFAQASGTTPGDYRYASVGLNYSLGRAYFSASHIWTDRLTYTYGSGASGFVFELPAQNRWVGSLTWTF